LKRLKYFCLAFLVAFLLAIPVAAQKGEKGERNNNGAGEPHGKARAEEVQADNHKPSKGSKSQGKKTRTREGWEKKAKHNGSKK